MFRLVRILLKILHKLLIGTTLGTSTTFSRVRRAVSTVTETESNVPWLQGSRVPRDYWADPQHRALYVNWLLVRVGVSTVAELTYPHFTKNGGNGLITIYGHSVHNVISSLDETRDKDASLQARPKKPNRYWNSIENQRAELDAIGARIGVREGFLDPWYRLETTTLDEMGGRTIRKYYSSFYEMLKTVYPEHNWDPFRFPLTQVSLAKHKSVSLEAAIARLEETLEITQPEKWYRVTTKQLQSSGIYYIIHNNGGLYQALKRVRPDYPWDESKFVGVFFDGAQLLGAFLRQIFSNLEIISNYSFPHSALSLSFYIPQLNLGFLYQTPADYGLTDRTGTASVSLFFDPSIQSEALKNKIEVIPIPFWWDRTKESLFATISERSAIPLTGIAKASPIPKQTEITLSTWRRLK